MDKRDRWIPWAIASTFFAALFMLGAAWDASFEAAPANSEQVSLGASRIRDLKNESRGRLEEEHCFGSGFGGSGCTSDSGFHREGSGRVFYQNAAPTALLNSAATALGANDDGRMWIDADGPDNIAANADDNQINVWTGSAFAAPRIESLSGFALSGLATDDILRYNGTNWANVKLTTFDFDLATFQADEAFTNGTCVAPCTVTDVPDHVGGSDTNNYPEVSIPSTPSTGVWDIYVDVMLYVRLTSGDNGIPVCRLNEDIDDVDTFPTVSTGAVLNRRDAANSNGDMLYCILKYVRRGATLGSDYAYRISMTDQGTGNSDWEVEDTAAPAAAQGTSFLRVEARPRRAF